MAKDALIKLRCSEELKERLTKLAGAREQSVSDFVRTKLLELIPGLEADVGIVHEPKAKYVIGKGPAGEAARQSYEDLRRRDVKAGASATPGAGTPPPTPRGKKPKRRR